MSRTSRTTRRTRTGRRVGRRMEPRYVKRRQRGLAVLIAAIVLMIGAVVYIGVRVSSSSGTDYQGDGNGQIELVEVAEGSSLSELGPELEERGIVKTDAAFQSAAMSTQGASAIEPGFYRMQGEMSAQAAVDALLDPDNRVELLDVQGGATLMDVTVLGRDTRYGIYSLISQSLCGAHDDAEGCLSPEEIAHAGATADLAALNVPDWAREPIEARGDDPRRLEGLIMPGQYVLNPTMSAEEILADLIKRSADQYNETGIVERAQAVGLSPYELLTAASLVERESPAGEFDKVARVILNRLAEPMRLEFDSTVNYDVAEQEVATTDEDRARETPWNTYAKDGLPDTPIASPSAEAVEAMEHPAEGNWKFFVTVDSDGTTVFNDDYDSHLADVNRAIESGVLDSNRGEAHTGPGGAEDVERAEGGDAPAEGPSDAPAEGQGAAERGGEVIQP